MYVHAHVHIYAHRHSTYTCMHACVHIRVWVRHMCTHVCMHIYMCRHNIYVWMHVCGLRATVSAISLEARAAGNPRFSVSTACQPGPGPCPRAPAGPSSSSRPQPRRAPRFLPCCFPRAPSPAAIHRASRPPLALDSSPPKGTPPQILSSVPSTPWHTEGAGLVFAEGNHKGGLSSLSLYRGDPRAGRRRDPAATELRAGNQTGPYPSLPQLPCRAYGAQTRDHGARPRPLQSKPSGLRLKAAPPSGELRAQCSPTRDPGPCMRLSHHLLQEATCPSLERCPSSCAPGHSAPVCTLTLALQPVTCMYTCLSPDRSCFAEFSISVLRTVPGARSAFIQSKEVQPEGGLHATGLFWSQGHVLLLDTARMPQGQAGTKGPKPGPCLYGHLHPSEGERARDKRL